MPFTKKYESTLCNKSWLVQKYTVAGLNASQIATELGCAPQAVYLRLKRYGIPLKTLIEAQSIRRKAEGSSAPRPKRKFLETLHNKEWMVKNYGECKSLTELARRAGCSVPSAAENCRKHGIIAEDERAQDPRTGVRNPAQWKGPLELSEVGARKRSRETYKDSDGPTDCTVCGSRAASDLNHKDRNPWNFALTNLEKLCEGCHSGQHAEETWVMIEWLRDLYRVPYIQVHMEARKRILSRPRGQDVPLFERLGLSTMDAELAKDWMKTHHPEAYAEMRREIIAELKEVNAD